MKVSHFYYIVYGILVTRLLIANTIALGNCSTLEYFR